MLQKLRSLAGVWKRRLLGGPESRRAAYKSVWNAQARSEEAAKIAVAGYTDESQFSRTAEATLDFLESSVGIKSSDTILEIGCGVGRVGRVLAPRCREWIGADVSENMLAHTRRRLADLTNVRTITLSGYDLSPLADFSVDLVYCTVVFMHLDEWERYRYVREAFRILRPGGRLFIDNFNLLSDEGWVLFEQVLGMDPLARPPHVSRSSTPQELAVYLKRAGFTQIQQQESGLWVMSWGVKPI